MRFLLISHLEVDLKSFFILIYIFVIVEERKFKNDVFWFTSEKFHSSGFKPFCGCCEIKSTFFFVVNFISSLFVLVTMEKQETRTPKGKRFRVKFLFLNNNNSNQQKALEEIYFLFSSRMSHVSQFYFSLNWSRI